MLITKNNIQFQIIQERATDGAPFWEWVNNNQWENETFAFLDKYLIVGQGLLDLGAWMGPLTLYAAAKGHNCWSFEPDPVAYHMLQENILANNFPQIKYYNLAIGQNDGQINLGLKGQRGDSMSSILLPSPDQLKVEIVKLTRIIQQENINNISVMKIDIEGYEIIIGDEIIAAAKLLNYPVILLSLHQPLYPEMTNIETLLQLFQPFYTFENNEEIVCPTTDFPQICLIPRKELKI